MHTAAEPLKQISRTHSYRRGDMNVASVGLRIGAYLVVTCITATISGICIPVPPISVLVSLVLFLSNLACYFNGQDLPMSLMDMQMIDAKTGKPFGFILFFVSQFLFAILFLFEIFFLPCTGKSLSQRIMGAEVIIVQRRGIA